MAAVCRKIGSRLCSERGGKKQVVFFSVIGPAAYKILRNLLALAKPGEKTYSELVDALSKHAKPTPSEIVERCKFHSRSRRADKNVAVLQFRRGYDLRSFGVWHQ